MAIKLLQAGIDRIVILEKGDSVGVHGGTTPIRVLPAMFHRTSTRIRFIPGIEVSRLHWDMTSTISLYGDYEGADEEFAQPR